MDYKDFKKEVEEIKSKINGKKREILILKKEILVLRANIGILELKLAGYTFTPEEEKKWIEMDIERGMDRGNRNILKKQSK